MRFELGVGWTLGSTGRAWDSRKEHAVVVAIGAARVRPATCAALVPALRMEVADGWRAGVAAALLLLLQVLHREALSHSSTHVEKARRTRKRMCKSLLGV